MLRNTSMDYPRSLITRIVEREASYVQRSIFFKQHFITQKPQQVYFPDFEYLDTMNSYGRFKQNNTLLPFTSLLKKDLMIPPLRQVNDELYVQHIKYVDQPYNKKFILQTPPLNISYALGAPPTNNTYDVKVYMMMPENSTQETYAFFEDLRQFDKKVLDYCFLHNVLQNKENWWHLVKSQENSPLMFKTKIKDLELKQKLLQNYPEAQFVATLKIQCLYETKEFCGITTEIIGLETCRIKKEPITPPSSPNHVFMNAPRKPLLARSYTMDQEQAEAFKKAL